MYLTSIHHYGWHSKLLKVQVAFVFCVYAGC